MFAGGTGRGGERLIHVAVAPRDKPQNRHTSLPPGSSLHPVRVTTAAGASLTGQKALSTELPVMHRCWLACLASMPLLAMAPSFPTEHPQPSPQVLQGPACHLRGGQSAQNLEQACDPKWPEESS